MIGKVLGHPVDGIAGLLFLERLPGLVKAGELGKPERKDPGLCTIVDDGIGLEKGAFLQERRPNFIGQFPARSQIHRKNGQGIFIGGREGHRQVLQAQLLPGGRREGRLQRPVGHHQGIAGNRNTVVSRFDQRELAGIRQPIFIVEILIKAIQRQQSFF
ncbi:hypothetical protein SDC9_195919 [bioreactor metagenome]|uniref:Uncharacterized protein n=1 Tax=bioreactor metagenome TaxID=1076179 RepID=A0A645IBU7_9ZZZZ